MSSELKGSCLCGSIRFTVRPPIRPVVACHCEKCRKQTGHFKAAAAALRANLDLSGEDALSWFNSGENSRRGFCSRCGSKLFFEVIGGEQIGFMPGAIDGALGLEMTTHIFTAGKGDYYALPEGCDAHVGDYPPALKVPSKAEEN